MSEQETPKLNSDREKEFLFSWYGKLPTWAKWLLFFPMANLIAMFLFFPIGLLKQSATGFIHVILGLIHSPIVEIYFLLCSKYLVPNYRKKTILILIILRALFLLAFIGQPILIYLGVDMTYDAVYFAEFGAEILVLLAAIKIYKEFDNISLGGTRKLLLYTVYAYLFLMCSLLIEVTLEFLSKMPIIGGLFEYLRHLRNNVY
ncbi:hypothetical protein KAR91_43030 [Candidatus Pacearchaeota archaeon]|nr:hypothetical protein [Candidatus Pacearchaeota archaeon]